MFTEAADHLPATELARARAAAAHRSVTSLFGARLLGLPTTHLARRGWPSGRLPDREWHYWWQAHYLDALVDAALREQRSGDLASADAAATRGRRLLNSIWLRNGMHFPNAFFDDMAWLALAVGRLSALVSARDGRPPRLIGLAERRLGSQLRSAHTPELGGGLYWSKQRDRKNVPASAPAAIWFARYGESQRAHELVGWIYDQLFDPDRGVILDTLYLDGSLDRTAFPYNQGTVLGALLELGDQSSRIRAEALVNAIDQTMCVAPHVLSTSGGHDGGLFTGILVRYLALAARDSSLSPTTRGTASRLVNGTAEALWEGSEVRQTRAGQVRVFSESTRDPAGVTYPAGRMVELSTQVQAWTILEAACALT